MNLAANRSRTHRTIYVTLTDGHIGDHAESVKLCERIRSEANTEMPEPVFYMLALGDAVNFCQLEKLIYSANGSLVYEFMGNKICDLLQKSERSMEGVETILRIFKEYIVLAGAKKVEMLEEALKKLENMIKEAQANKKKALEDEPT